MRKTQSSGEGDFWDHSTFNSPNCEGAIISVNGTELTFNSAQAVVKLNLDNDGMLRET